MKTRSFHLVGTLLFGSFFGMVSAWAVELPQFVAEMKKLRVPVRYIEEALPTLRSIRFTRLGNSSGGTIEAVYNRLTNEIQFDLAIQDPSTGTLKKSDQLSPDQIGTIFHELFHVYMNNIARPQQTDLFRYFASQADSLYDHHQRDFHEEAYGAFITEVVAQHFNFRRMMSERTPDARERIRSNPRLTSIYEAAFKERYVGYYRNFWGQFIDSDVNLPEADRTSILYRLFDQKLSPSFSEAFSESSFAKLARPRLLSCH